MSVNLDSIKDLRLYFAYGSNMAPSSVEERGLKLRVVGIACLEHYQLMFNKISTKDASMGFANIVPFWDKKVYGILYDMANEPAGSTRSMKDASDSQRLKALEYATINLSILDKKEGYPNHYQRTCVGVKIGDRLLNAFTYIATPGKTSDTNLLIEEKYISKITEGFETYFEDHSVDGMKHVNESKELMQIWKS
jgi:hypothetical protein